MDETNNITFNLWGHIEAVRLNDTGVEEHIKLLVGPVRLVDTDDLPYGMLSLWSATEGEDQPSPEEVLDAALEILEELENDKYEWEIKPEVEE